MKHLTLNPTSQEPPTRDLPTGAKIPDSLPEAKETKVHPSNAGGENGRILFVGTATTILFISPQVLYCLHERKKLIQGGSKENGKELD